MAGPSLVLVVDEAPASAALFAALVGLLGAGRDRDPLASFELGLTLEGPRESILSGITRTCVRRGLPVEREGEALIIAGRSIPLVSDSDARPSTRARLLEHRVELQPRGAAWSSSAARSSNASEPGERAELLAASALLDVLEHGSGMRWAVLAVIEGRDVWHASVDLSERRADAAIEAGLRRSFPVLVGRVAWSLAIGPQLGAALHLNVLLGTGASVEGLHDQIAQLAQHTGQLVQQPRSRWPRLRAQRGCGSADSLGDPRVLVDLDAIISAGPLVRIAAYYDPPAILAGDLLRRLALA